MQQVKLVRPITARHLNKETMEWKKIHYPVGEQFDLLYELALDPRRVEGRFPFLVRHTNGKRYLLGEGVFEHVG